jgi:hypothetical protein
MYKHFQGGNAKTICDHLNKNKMQIHSIEQTNGLFHCIAEPSDDDREIRSLGGSILVVTKNLNEYERQIEGKVLMRGHAATAFYRFDESMEAKKQAEMDSAKKSQMEAAEKAEKAAKKAEMKKKMEDLQAEMAKQKLIKKKLSVNLK